MTKYNRFSLELLTILCCCVASMKLHAQEFGDPEYDMMEYRSIGGGMSLQHFKPATGNNLSDSAGIHYANPQVHGEYRDPDTRIALGYSSYLLQGKSGAALSFMAESRKDLPLIKGSRRSGLYLPISLSTNYLRATNGVNSVRNVDIVSLGVGTGLEARWIEKNFGMELRGSAVFHYSTQSFSVDDGTSNLFFAEIVLLFPETIGNGILVGYRYDFQIWKMKRADLNYQREVYGPFLSIFL